MTVPGSALGTAEIMDMYEEMGDKVQTPLYYSFTLFLPLSNIFSSLPFCLFFFLLVRQWYSSPIPSTFYSFHFPFFNEVKKKSFCRLLIPLDSFPFYLLLPFLCSFYSVPFFGGFIQRASIFLKPLFSCSPFHSLFHLAVFLALRHWFEVSKCKWKANRF